MAEIITTNSFKSSTSFKNESELTDGKYLRKEYMDTIDEDTYLNYKKKASDILDELVEQIHSNIKSGKPPIAQKDTMQSTTGIIAHNKDLEALFNDFKFSTILGDMAIERDLKIDFQGRPIGIDRKTNQPVLGMILICTFK